MLTSLLPSLGSLAIIATLVAVIRYTAETVKLRKEAQKQNELTLRPLIMPVPINPFSEYVLKLINIGKSPAFNIEIDTDEDPENIHSWVPGSGQTFLVPGEDGRWDCSPISIEKTKNKYIIFDIQYENVEGDLFYTKVRINFKLEEQSFLETGKVRNKTAGGIMMSITSELVAKEYLRFLAFIAIGLIIMPFVQAAISLGIGDAWKSLINFDFLFNTTKGPLPAWLFMCIPYIAFLFIRSVLWARKQVTTVKPPRPGQ